MNKNNYPSSDQILNHQQLITTQQNETLKKWKTKYYKNKWKNLTNKEKHWSLYRLAQQLLTDRIIHIKIDNYYASILNKNTLIFKKDAPSIISTLHEIGHLIYGTSELKACAFSYQLFNANFPKECNNLTWKGHMLVKKQQKQQSVEKNN